MLEDFEARELMNVLVNSSFNFVGTKAEMIEKIEFYELLDSPEFLQSYLDLGGMNAQVRFLHDDGSQDVGNISIVDFRLNEIWISYGTSHVDYDTISRTLAHIF